MKDQLNLSKLTKEERNEICKELLFNQMTINMLSKALTVECFRNGIVEDIHCEGKLSDEDMKTLNKDIVNKVARILYLFKEERYSDIIMLLGFGYLCAKDWDDPEIDLDEINRINELEKTA